MSDVFLVLAQAPGGLSCFLLPRVLPDGTRNGMHLQRLKDKLGNRSNASAEVEYDERRGLAGGGGGPRRRTIIEMVNMTRLDCVLGAATSMRSGAVQAAHHAAHRSAFGALLADQPLMANVLADLAVESEAATTVTFRLAGATDRAAAGDEQEAAFRRLALAATKYWVCKRAPAHAARGAGVLRRQRLRGGIGPATAVPRGPVAVDLGGVRQRCRPGHAARHGPSARIGRGVLRRGRPGGRRGPRGWTPRSPGCGPS